MNRVVHAVTAAVLLAGAGAGPALAASQQPYWPTGEQQVRVSAERVDPGGKVTVSFGGFKPLSMVTIVLQKLDGSAPVQTSLGPLRPMSSGEGVITRQADQMGVVTVDVTLPEAGVYRVEAEGVDPSGTPRTVATEVVAAPASAGSSAAGASAGEGGNGVATALGVGAVLALAGGGVVLHRRIRPAQAD